ncbi:MAG: LURP-one-related family protein [Lachnospiraceae bacterium]|nr:LURP-one-related family protein [Lachnospiraceae bacterium]
MKLLIKQRVFSWTDTYDIYDEAGMPKYYVKAEFLALGHQIHVYDRGGQEVGFISQKLFRLMPQFEIFAFGRSQGLIRKEFTFFRPKYHVECRNWSVNGDVFGWDYDVLEQNRTVAHISKELFRWGDTYVINFARPEDEIMVLLLVIAIDAANCSNN